MLLKGQRTYIHSQIIFRLRLMLYSIWCQELAHIPSTAVHDTLQLRRNAGWIPARWSPKQKSQDFGSGNLAHVMVEKMQKKLRRYIIGKYIPSDVNQLGHFGGLVLEGQKTEAENGVASQFSAKIRLELYEIVL